MSINADKAKYFFEYDTTFVENIKKGSVIAATKIDLTDGKGMQDASINELSLDTTSGSAYYYMYQNVTKIGASMTNRQAFSSEELLYKDSETYTMKLKTSISSEVQTQSNITDDYAVIFASNYLSLIQSYATVITPVSIIDEIDALDNAKSKSFNITKFYLIASATFDINDKTIETYYIFHKKGFLSELYEKEISNERILEKRLKITLDEEFIKYNSLQH